MINHIFYAGLRSDMMSALAPESNSTTGVKRAGRTEHEIKQQREGKHIHS
jgi:hypothetical protein